MKNKKILTMFTLLASSSVALPIANLVSCSKSNKQTNTFDADFDKEYGINEATYIATKEVLRNKRIKQLKDAGKSPSEIASDLNELSYLCSSFETKANSMNFGYSTRCFSLSRLAWKAYGITLDTSSSVSEQDVFNLFDKSLPSIRIFLHNSGLDSKADEIIAKARESYRVYIGGGEIDGQHVEGTLSKYGSPLVTLYDAKTWLFTLFADVNDNIGLVSAQRRLQEFLSDYKITIENSPTDESNTLDVLLSTYPNDFQVGNPIDNSLMNKIFTIVPVDSQDGEPIKFNGDSILPGYRLQPIYKGYESDPYTNQHQLKIDWACVKNSYIQSKKNSKDLEKVTAHIYAGSKVDERNVSNIKSMSDVFGEDEIGSIDYPISLSLAAEKKALKDAYFNPEKLNWVNSDSESSQKVDPCDKQYLDFDWVETESNDKNSFDRISFYSGVKITNKNSTNNDSEQYVIDINSLANSGLSAIVYDANIYSKDKNSADPKETSIQLKDVIASDAINFKQIKPKAPTDDFSILNKLLDNCSINSLVNIVKNQSNNENITNNIFVTYNNSIYTRNKIDDNDASYEFGAKNTSGFGIGEGSYKHIVAEWNKLNKYVKLNSDISDELKQQNKDINDELIINSVMEGLVAALTGVCVLESILKPITAIAMYGIIAATVASFALQSAGFVLFMLAERKPFLKYYNGLKKIHGSHETKALKDILNKYQNDYYIPESNDDLEISNEQWEESLSKFRDTIGHDETQKFENFKKAVDWFNDLNNQPEYQNFQELLEKNPDAKPDEYQENAKKWSVGGPYFITNMTLMGLSFALDIISTILSNCDRFVLALPIEMRDEITQVRNLKRFAWMRAQIKLVQKMRTLNKAADAARRIVKVALNSGGKTVKILFETTEDANNFLELYRIFQLQNSKTLIKMGEMASNAASKLFDNNFLLQQLKLSNDPQFKDLLKIDTLISRAKKNMPIDLMKLTSKEGNNARSSTWLVDLFTKQYMNKIVDGSERASKCLDALANAPENLILYNISHGEGVTGGLHYLSADFEKLFTSEENLNKLIKGIEQIRDDFKYCFNSFDNALYIDSDLEFELELESMEDSINKLKALKTAQLGDKYLSISRKVYDITGLLNKALDEIRFFRISEETFKNFSSFATAVEKAPEYINSATGFRGANTILESIFDCLIKSTREFYSGLATCIKIIF